MTITPDMSFGSLGVRGLQSFNNFTFGEGLKELDKAYRSERENWNAANAKTGRIVWQPIVDDVHDHLVEGVNFVRTLREVLRSTLES